MPTINVLYWNIQNFGNPTPYKEPVGPLCDFVAQVALQTDADLLCIMEVKQNSVNAGFLARLQQALWALPAPFNNWYYDVVKGAASDADSVDLEPYARAQDLMWDVGHSEGYAVFWRQNLAKFRMDPATPITDPYEDQEHQNTQSMGVKARANQGVLGMVYGADLPNPVTVPNMNPFSLPAGTTAPLGAPIISGGGIVVQAGATSGAPIVMQSGDVLPAGTVIGQAGLLLAGAVLNLNPILIPGGFTLTDALTLPAAGTVVLPQHAVGLGIVGRPCTPGRIPPPFDPAGNNDWDYVPFTRGAGQARSIGGSRRPAFCQLDVNRPGMALAQRLVSLGTYHAPSATTPSQEGVALASLLQQMYQAYDFANDTWINNAFAVMGGDFNVELDIHNIAYQWFTLPINQSGAGCNTGGVPNLRVNQPGINGNPPAWNPLNKTTVQLMTSPRGGGLPILSPDPDRYRMMAIDNAFYRGFTPNQVPAAAVGEAYNLLSAVVAGGAPAAGLLPVGAVQNFQQITLINQTMAALMANQAPPPTNQIASIQNFDTMVMLGQTGPGLNVDPGVAWARTAAECIRLCVSDHLPVVFKMVL